jgi:hypothetical protein
MVAWKGLSSTTYLILVGDHFNKRRFRFPAGNCRESESPTLRFPRRDRMRRRKPLALLTSKAYVNLIRPKAKPIKTKAQQSNPENYKPSCLIRVLINSEPSRFKTSLSEPIEYLFHLGYKVFLFIQTYPLAPLLK